MTTYYNMFIKIFNYKFFSYRLLLLWLLEAKEGAPERKPDFSLIPLLSPPHPHSLGFGLSLGGVLPLWGGLGSPVSLGCFCVSWEANGSKSRSNFIWIIYSEYHLKFSYVFGPRKDRCLAEINLSACSPTLARPTIHLSLWSCLTNASPICIVGE